MGAQEPGVYLGVQLQGGQERGAEAAAAAAQASVHWGVRQTERHDTVWACVCVVFVRLYNVQNLFLNLPRLSPTRIKTLAPTSLLGAHRGGLCLAHQLVLLAFLLAFLLALLCGRLGLCRRLRRRR